MKYFLLIFALLAPALTLPALNTPIANGVLTTPLNVNGQPLMNVGDLVPKAGSAGYAKLTAYWSPVGTLTNSYQIIGSKYGFNTVVNYNPSVSYPGTPIWTGMTTNGMTNYLAFNVTNNSVLELFGPDVWLMTTNWPVPVDLNVSGTTGIYFIGGTGLDPEMPNYDGATFIYDINNLADADATALALMPVMAAPQMDVVTLNTTNVTAQTVTAQTMTAGTLTLASGAGGNVRLVTDPPPLYPQTTLAYPKVFAVVGDSISTTNTGGLGWPGWWDSWTNLNQQGHLFQSTNYIRWATSGIGIATLTTNYVTSAVHLGHPPVTQRGLCFLETGQNDHDKDHMGNPTNFIPCLTNLVGQLHADNYDVAILLQWSNSWYVPIIATNTTFINSNIIAKTNIFAANNLPEYVLRSDLWMQTNQQWLMTGPHLVPVGAQWLAAQVGAQFPASASSWLPNAVVWLHTPSSGSEPGSPGQGAYDATYFYIWTATNVNKRIAFSAW